MSQSNFSETKYWLRTAHTISEALPYMQRYAGKRFVVKYGGHAMVDPELAKVFAQDIVLMKQIGIHPIVVHGGGPQIGHMLDRLQIKSDFIDGLRVTDAATVEVVEMVLAGTINKQIVAAINAAGGSAIGISGKDAGLMEARRLFLEKNGKQIDIGLVGDPAKVDPTVIDLLQNSHFIPVIAPVAFGADGQTYNVNADTAAGAIAAAAKATRLLMLTDVAGVLDKTGKLIEDLSVSQVRQLMSDGTISGGMIPKLDTCVDAVEQGVEASVILDGRIPHALLLEIFTPHGLGTLVHKG
ncbi:MAG TPA: acetylglutamate kinase [Hypericibacter adhaerens]|jgi:acetylglutamate kinase|uniref:Acetylglutamate kinase n=1 Tax=Hypericibacter adhaerens TaxID=2602016 RepID=A0A5J6MSP4_9PROT|nr:acetylglutamate kinase [Hypericibacter adhaerens]QEX20598.1 acetylglutamate kinase [Hypericibacter adhaerens]HWA41786.1 acetylglutamate kinase [Hypericibacter adhaerens]